MILRRLRGSAHGALGPAITATLERLGYRNVFNPSLHVRGDDVAVAVRAMPPAGTKPFHALLLRGTIDGELRLDVDLTAHAAGHGVDVVADPKLVELGGDLHVTWNSGYHPRANSIHLMRLDPEPGVPQRCEVVGERRAVEKNWGFALDGGRLHALYELGPVTPMRLVDGELGGHEPLRFERRPTAHGPEGLTLGSQPLRRGDHHLVLAHERVVVRGKRAYAGRLVRIDGLGGQEPTARASRRRLLHSLRDAVPRRGAHNPNLLSATYFSGLASTASGLLLGYGINDVGLGVAEIDEARLW